MTHADFTAKDFDQILDLFTHSNLLLFAVFFFPENKKVGAQTFNRGLAFPIQAMSLLLLCNLRCTAMRAHEVTENNLLPFVQAARNSYITVQMWCIEIQTRTVAGPKSIQ